MQEITSEFFILKVKQEFSFLVDEYGYSTSIVHPFKVDFSSELITVSVSYDDRGCELNFNFTTKNTGSNNIFDLSEIYESFDDLGGIRRINGYLSSDAELIGRRLEEISQMLQKYCVSILLGDEKILTRLTDASAKKSEIDTNLAISDPARRRAESAWEQKDYEKVVSLYEEILEYLDEKDKRRYSYAQKKLLKSK